MKSPHNLAIELEPLSFTRLELKPVLFHPNLYIIT